MDKILLLKILGHLFSAALTILTTWASVVLIMVLIFKKNIQQLIARVTDVSEIHFNPIGVVLRDPTISDKDKARFLRHFAYRVDIREAINALNKTCEALRKHTWIIKERRDGCEMGSAIKVTIDALEELTAALLLINDTEIASLLATIHSAIKDLRTKPERIEENPNSSLNAFQALDIEWRGKDPAEFQLLKELKTRLIKLSVKYDI